MPLVPRDGFPPARPAVYVENEFWHSCQDLLSEILQLSLAIWGLPAGAERQELGIKWV